MIPENTNKVEGSSEKLMDETVIFKRSEKASERRVRPHRTLKPVLSL